MHPEFDIDAWLSLPPQSDFDAIKSDWETVGNDLRIASGLVPKGDKR